MDDEEEEFRFSGFQSENSVETENLAKKTKKIGENLQNKVNNEDKQINLMQINPTKNLATPKIQLEYLENFSLCEEDEQSEEIIKKSAGLNLGCKQKDSFDRKNMFREHVVFKRDSDFKDETAKLEENVIESQKDTIRKQELRFLKFPLIKGLM